MYLCKCAIRLPVWWLCTLCLLSGLLPLGRCTPGQVSRCSTATTATPLLTVSSTPLRTKERPLEELDTSMIHCSCRWLTVGELAPGSKKKEMRECLLCSALACSIRSTSFLRATLYCRSSVVY
ncbi:hypothetical protein BDA96_09G230300 [Sorghum bicolor]|uniref:Secreted protein n=1 Tax=Sorghum bicolor TaxID=4558 RepID=A0A921QC40_SORBI|nr:hypothetical protein BDA96_09G230300 [Sorghum bicolor]